MTDKSKKWYLMSIIVLVFGYAGLGIGMYYRDYDMTRNDIELTGDYTHTVGIVTPQNVIRVSAELALDDKKQMLGMMYRSRMDEQAGMLFIFPNTEVRHFWMRNTLIPLDILFIDASGRIVNVHRNATPHDETLISSEKPAMAVLEIKGGMSDMWGVKEGAIVHSPLLMR